MAQYEKLLLACTSKDVDQRMIEKYMIEFELDAKGALLLERACNAAVNAAIACIGRTVDSLDENLLVKVVALGLVPRVAAQNLVLVADVIWAAAAEQLMTSPDIEITAPNPLHPECDCANCELTRALSKDFVAADKIAQREGSSDQS